MDDARKLIEELIDPDDCQYDHNALCQTHGCSEKPCPHERAKKFLAQPATDSCTSEERAVIDAAVAWNQTNYRDANAEEVTLMKLSDLCDILLAARKKVQ